MIEYLTTPTDVLALRVHTPLTQTELAGLVERLERALDANPKTHMYVEIDRFSGEDWRVALEMLPHGFSLMRHLDRYGRIAVVSDDKFVRGWSRFESAMLPLIRYEIFDGDEADRALQWVEGKIKFPHEAALTFIETDNPLVLAYAIDGTLTKTDMDQAIATLEPRLTRELGPISVLARVGEILFSDPASFLNERYFRFKRETLARVERYANIGGPAWLQLMDKATAPFVPFDLRYFDRADEDKAWDWVGAHEAPEVSEVSQAKTAVPA
jgi:hypothetical protein